MKKQAILYMSNFLCLMILLPAWGNVNTNGQEGVVRTVSAKPIGKSKMNVGFGVNFAQSSEYVQGPTYNLGHILDMAGQETIDFPEPAKMFSSNLFLSMGLANFWDLAMALPFYYDWAGFGDVRDGGLGDLEISSKFLLPPISLNKLFYQAVLVSITAPTGMRGSGLFPRHPHFLANDNVTNPAKNFYSTDYITVKPMLAFTFDVGSPLPKVPLKIHINIGGVFTEENKQNTMAGALALEYTPADFITLFADFSGESRWHNLSSGYNLRKDPLWATPGIRINTPSGMYLYLAGDFSMSSTKTQDRMDWDKKGYKYSTGVTPLYGVQFAFGWNGFISVQDKDHDGISDNIDKCPNEPEDIDGFEDSDGCPDPDNDKDGICDPWVAEKGAQKKYASVCKGIDKCPNVAEDVDGFQDDDGCPDPDNDGDGIPDVKDQCPNVSEDFDGFQDNDGCPDYDNDKDGIPDSLDKCPNDPEDIDSFEDKDGCPDLDNDKDGIPDLKDKCPSQPEIFNGYLDEDGCPDTIPKPPAKKEPDFPRQQILQGLEFRTGKAELLFSSYQTLDRIVKTLKEYPEIEIEIRAYTDSMGKYSTNMQLSQMRAEAVRQYLINQGIDSQHVRAMGFGPSNPISDNRTAAGRAMNRRIEVVRLK